MTIHYDTGDPMPRGPGRPMGSNYDYLDTGPLLNLHRNLIANPDQSFESAAEPFADDIHNANGCSHHRSRIRRLRRSYSRWLEQKSAD